jgi:hypothetical protein
MESKEEVHWIIECSLFFEWQDQVMENYPLVFKHKQVVYYIWTIL